MFAYDKCLLNHLKQVFHSFRNHSVKCIGFIDVYMTSICIVFIAFIFKIINLYVYQFLLVIAHITFIDLHCIIAYVAYINELRLPFSICSTLLAFTGFYIFSVTRPFYLTFLFLVDLFTISY